MVASASGGVRRAGLEIITISGKIHVRGFRAHPAETACRASNAFLSDTTAIPLHVLPRVSYRVF